MTYTIKAKEMLMDQESEEYREIELNFQNYAANVLLLSLSNDVFHSHYQRSS